MRNRVVITGYGAITPLGLDVKETWNNLLAGKTGVDYITLFDASEYPIKIAAEVKGFNPLDFMNPATAKYSDRFTQFALSACIQAIDHANLVIDDTNRNDTGITIGSGIGGVSTALLQFDRLQSRGPTRVSPFTIPMMIVDSAASAVSITLGIHGPNLGIVSSCATGTDAIGIAYRTIMSGEAKVMIAGGSDAAVTSLGIAGFSQAGALSKNPDPQKASRPFDARRDGFVIGEGSAVLILEDYEYAVSRKARIRAEIVSYSSTSDAFHITQPLETGEQAARAIERAITGGKLQSIDYINAHGTSTPLNDLGETKAIKKVFGNKAYGIPISSIKSMVGHMLGGAGALEIIVCCEAINTGAIPPTINLENPDPECDLDYVPNKARECQVNTAISNSFGFGGHNSVIALSRVV
jgi:3-oxoacyl-[acyl-carrier-protein] synthase II